MVQGYQSNISRPPRNEADPLLGGRGILILDPPKMGFLKTSEVRFGKKYFRSLRSRGWWSGKEGGDVDSPVGWKWGFYQQHVPGGLEDPVPSNRQGGCVREDLIAGQS